MRSLLISLVLALGVAPIAPIAPSLAQPAAPTPSIQARVDALIDEGTRLADAQDHRGALQRFDEAYALAPSAKLSLKRGVVLARMGRRVDAADAFAAALDDDALDPALIETVRAQLAKLDARLGRLTIEVADHQVADIRIGNGPWAEATTRPRRVQPGAYRVEARAAGRDGPIVIAGGTIGPGEARAVTIELPATPRRARRHAPPARRGYGALGYGALGLGAAAVIGGAAVLLVVDEAPVTTPTSDPTYTEATVPGAITLGVGVALVGLGSYLLLADHRRSQRITPTVAVRTSDAVLGVAGRF